MEEGFHEQNRQLALNCISCLEYTIIAQFFQKEAKSVSKSLKDQLGDLVVSMTQPIAEVEAVEHTLPPPPSLPPVADVMVMEEGRATPPPATPAQAPKRKRTKKSKKVKEEGVAVVIPNQVALPGPSQSLSMDKRLEQLIYGTM